MKLYIVVDKNNKVMSISEGAKIEMDGCDTHEIYDDLDFSLTNGYIFKDGKVEFSEDRWNIHQKELQLLELQTRREEECFSVINRGETWYDLYVNTEERKAELEEWYQAWLDVTETLVIPEKPEWIN